jgi:hypothetical protein
LATASSSTETTCSRTSLIRMPAKCISPFTSLRRKCFKS